MYSYNLIIKHERLEQAAVRAMVNRQLTRRFGDDVFYHETSMLTHEVIVVVSHESKRTLQATLGEWFAEDNDKMPPFPTGALLHYRQILSGERVSA